MANSFLKPSIIASTALGLLESQVVLPQFMWRDAQASFTGRVGPAGDTVTIRIPARTQAREYAWRNDRTTAIVVDELTESSLDVKLDTHLYNAIAVTDEELSLDIASFGDQVLQPQVRAIADAVEARLAAMMTAATYDTELVVDETDPYKTLVDARTALNKAGVPLSDRFCVVGPDIEAAMLKSDHLARADQSGSTDALRDAQVGRMAGFQVFVTNSLPGDEGYCFHRTAYALVQRAPVVPDGATFGQSQSFAGLAMRWIRDYDATHLQDRSIVSTFMGANVMTDEIDGVPTLVRAVKMTLPLGS